MCIILNAIAFTLGGVVCLVMLDNVRTTQKALLDITKREEEIEKAIENLERILKDK